VGPTQGVPEIIIAGVAAHRPNGKSTLGERKMKLRVGAMAARRRRMLGGRENIMILMWIHRGSVNHCQTKEGLSVLCSLPASPLGNLIN
jgi:hypothetical protein